MNSPETNKADAVTERRKPETMLHQSPAELGAALLFAVVRVWRSVMWAFREIPKGWKSVASPWGFRVLFWRVCLVSRGAENPPSYMMWRLGRFGLLKPSYARTHPPLAASLFKLMREKMAVPFKDILSTSASSNVNGITSCHPGSGSDGMINAADGSLASSCASESVPLTRICTCEPEYDLSSSRVMEVCVGSANGMDEGRRTQDSANTTGHL